MVLFLILQTFHRFFQINGQVLPSCCLLPVPWSHRHSPHARTQYWSCSRPHKGFGEGASLSKAECVAHVTGTPVICPLSKWFQFYLMSYISYVPFSISYHFFILNLPSFPCSTLHCPFQWGPSSHSTLDITGSMLSSRTDNTGNFLRTKKFIFKTCCWKACTETPELNPSVCTFTISFWVRIFTSR